VIKTLSIKQSKDAFIVELITSTIPLFFLLLAVILFLNFIAAQYFPGPLIGTITLVLVLGFIVYSVVMYFYIKEHFKTKEYVVTHETVTELDSSRGMTYRSFEMKGLVALDIYQSWIAKKLKFGTITLRFMGGSHIQLNNIPTPEKYAVQIHKLVTKGFIEEEGDAIENQTELKDKSDPNTIQLK
jgi:hypothetical protein